MTNPAALLALEDGTLWHGTGFGAIGETTGEIVFNTSMTGYQEIITDPSYHSQIMVMTPPQVGNTGATPEDDESDRAWVAGFVIRELSPLASNYRSRQPLDAYLNEHGVVSITEVSTRALVRHIRTHGAMRAALSSTNVDPQRLLEMARTSRDMNGLDLAREVTCAKSYVWSESADPQWYLKNAQPISRRVGQASSTASQQSSSSRHVVAYD